MSPSTTKLPRIKSTAPGECAGTGLGHCQEPQLKFWTAAVPEMKAAAVTERHPTTDGSVAGLSPMLGYFSQIQLSFFKSGSTCQTHQDVLPHGDLNCTYTTPILRMEKTKHAELCEQTPNSSMGHKVALQKAGNGVWRLLGHELVAGPGQLRVRCLLAWSWALEPLW